jgi:hypothetical protein
MIRRAVNIVLLTCLGSLSPRWAGIRCIPCGEDCPHLAPRGMATIQTRDGTRHEVVRGTGWQVGDTVTCEYAASVRPS